jgi:DNA-binding response OmpR family regulator
VSNRERILVVDEISDTAEVLQAVLEPRGVTVNRVCRWNQTESATVANRPAVVVYDAESSADGDLPAGGNWHGVPQVIIGTMRVARPDRDGSDRNGPAAPAANRRYLQKPFQFAELVQAIEALIAPRAA